ncbi:MAG: hypothetical protein ACXWP4_21395 [Polyangiales bacterium]
MDVGPGNVIDRGTVIDYGSSKPLKDITITEVGVTGTTDSTGKYSLTVPKDTPLNLVLAGTDYTKTILGEQSFSSDYDRQEIPIPQLTLFHVGEGALDGYDTAKGSVYLLVQATGSCKDITGGTVTVKSPADAKIAYFKDKLPDTSVTSFVAMEGRLPAATIYNVPAGTGLSLDLTITHPTCKQKAFPAVVNGVTFTGKVNVEAGDANSVAFYFLE